MKTILKVLKWVGKGVGAVLLIIILSGLTFRAFGPSPHEPEGRLVDIGGFKLHINASGQKSQKPTVVIESGMGLPTEHYHWLNEGLKDSLRVVRYDRAGIGYSDLSDTPRDPETVARELHTLLDKSGESAPYIMVGHSFGGPHMRVFAQMYPDEVAGMVFIDCTHPERVERLNLPDESSSRFKNYMRMLKVQTWLCDLGILGIYDRAYGPILAGKGLPDSVNARMLDFSLNGKYAHGFNKEMNHYHSGLKRCGEANDFGDLPIRVFSAVEMNKEGYRARGIDPDKRIAQNMEMYQDFVDLSTNGKLFLIEANHNTIYTKKEHAATICKEILSLTKETGQKA